MYYSEIFYSDIHLFLLIVLSPIKLFYLENKKVLSSKYMKCINLEAQYIKTDQKADITLYSNSKICVNN